MGRLFRGDDRWPTALLLTGPGAKAAVHFVQTVLPDDVVATLTPAFDAAVGLDALRSKWVVLDEGRALDQLRLGMLLDDGVRVVAWAADPGEPLRPEQWEVVRVPAVAFDDARTVIALNLGCDALLVAAVAMSGGVSASLGLSIYPTHGDATSAGNAGCRMHIETRGSTSPQMPGNPSPLARERARPSGWSHLSSGYTTT